LKFICARSCAQYLAPPCPPLPLFSGGRSKAAVPMLRRCAFLQLFRWLYCVSQTRPRARLKLAHIFVVSAPIPASCACYPKSGMAMRRGRREQSEGTDCETAKALKESKQKCQPYRLQANSEVPQSTGLCMWVARPMFGSLPSLPRHGQASAMKAPLQPPSSCSSMKRKELEFCDDPISVPVTACFVAAVLDSCSWLARRQFGIKHQQGWGATPSLPPTGTQWHPPIFLGFPSVALTRQSTGIICLRT
jgi:hypothetical protein